MENIEAQAKQILIEATKLIEQGWCQKRYTITQKGIIHYCSIGAVLFAQRDLNFGYSNQLTNIVYEKLWEALGERINVSEWNDAPERTKEEVVNLFKKAQEI